jgi:hypothetical protein
MTDPLTCKEQFAMVPAGIYAASVPVMAIRVYEFGCWAARDDWCRRPAAVIAEMLGASVRGVRRAIATLRAEQLVEFDEGGRWRPLSPPSSLDRFRFARVPLRAILAKLSRQARRLHGLYCAAARRDTGRSWWGDGAISRLLGIHHRTIAGLKERLKGAGLIHTDGQVVTVDTHTGDNSMPDADKTAPSRQSREQEPKTRASSFRSSVGPQTALAHAGLVEALVKLWPTPADADRAGLALRGALGRKTGEEILHVARDYVARADDVARLEVFLSSIVHRWDTGGRTTPKPRRPKRPSSYDVPTTGFGKGGVFGYGGDAHDRMMAKVKRLREAEEAGDRRRRKREADEIAAGREFALNGGLAAMKRALGL